MQPEEFVPWMGSRTKMGPLKASEVTVPTCVGRRVGVPQGRSSPWMPRAEGWGVMTSLWSRPRPERMKSSGLHPQDHTNHRK